MKNDIQSLTIVKYNKIRKKDYFRSTEMLKNILINLVEWCINENFFPYGLIRSPLVSKKESIEFFVYLKIDKKSDCFDYRNEINKLFYTN